MDRTGQGEAREGGDMPGNEPRTGAESGNPPWGGDLGLPGLAAEADQPKGDVQPRQFEEATATGGGKRMHELRSGMISSLKPIIKFIREVDHKEIFQLCFMGLKASFTQVVFFMILSSNIYISGGLYDGERSSASRAIMVFMCVLPVGIGFAQTFDTLISQTHGSGNVRRVQVLLLRGTLLTCLVSLVCIIPLFYTEYILIAFNQDPECARHAQTCANFLLMVLPLSFMYQLHMRFLQNQNIFWPQILTGLIVCCVSFLMSVHNIVSSTTASIVAHFLLVFILLTMMLCGGFLKMSQQGLFLDVLQEWGPFCTDASLSVVMLCIKYWKFAVFFVATSLYSEVKLQVLTVAASVYIPAIMISRGLAAAASVRLGNALGAGDATRAKRLIDYTVFIGMLAACVHSGVMLAFADELRYSLRNDQEALEVFDVYLLRFCGTCGADTLATILEGVARGAGLLWKSAVVIGVCHAFGILFSVTLMYDELYFGGPWLGVTVGLASVMVFLLITIWATDTEKAVKDAQERAGVLIRYEVEMNRGPWDAATKDQLAQDRVTTRDDRLALLRSTTVVGGVLSIKQLFVRRGLVLLFIVALVLGCAVHRYMHLWVDSITFANDSLSTALPHLEH